MEKKINLIAAQDDDKIRVDIFINKHHKEISRTRIKNLILDKKLRINNQLITDPSKKIFIDDIPVSDEVQVIVESGLAKLKDLIVTGDDYELIFTAPEERSKEIASFAETAEVAVTKIGVLDGKPGAVKIIDSKGSAINVDRTGYTHF